MRTVEISVYKFHELSDKAKQKALDKYLEHETFDYITSEATASFEVWGKHFIEYWKEINYLEPYRNDYKANVPDGSEELTGQRLATYIWNNYRTVFYEGKYYGKLVSTNKDGTPIETSKQHPTGQRHVIRHSRILIEWDNCPLTGVCYDFPLIEPFIEFMNKPNEKETLSSLIDEAIRRLCKEVENEIEGNSTIETYADHCNANGYEFTEDGKRY